MSIGIHGVSTVLCLWEETTESQTSLRWEGKYTDVAGAKKSKYADDSSNSAVEPRKLDNSKYGITQPENLHPSASIRVPHADRYQELHLVPTVP